MRKIHGNCPKDDLCENYCCLPCACTITKVLVDVERIFTTFKQSKGVKQCIQSHKRSEGVKQFLQSDSECLPSKIRNIQMLLFKMIVLMYKETSIKIQKRDVVISFIMLLMLGYQIVLRDQ